MYVHVLLNKGFFEGKRSCYQGNCIDEFIILKTKLENKIASIFFCLTSLLPNNHTGTFY